MTLRCHGCAATVDPLDPFGLEAGTVTQCPNSARAPNVDHVLEWDPVSAGVSTWPGESETAINPFVRFRTLQHWYWLGRHRGQSDADLLSLVARVDRSIAGVAGSGFVITPFDRDDRASDALGVDLWAKDETGSVAGSHKARHLMGLLLHFDVQRLSARARLGIASCGNAALAAATLARGARRALDVFVPPSADPFVLERLKSLGATVTTCARTADSPPGDPCVHRFREMRKRGVLPFCCQGPENGLTLDGGCTLGYELATQLSLVGEWPARLFVPVGGGALAASVAQALDVTTRLGVGSSAALHCVQTEGCAPLHRAWRRVADRVLQALGASTEITDAEAATRLLAPDARDALAATLGFAASHRSTFMWPWEDEPASVAGGILDDETYDWFALVRAMLRTGGWPVVVTESQLERANEMATASADFTGTASLAGLVALRSAKLVTDGERCVTLYTGVRR